MYVAGEGWCQRVSDLRDPVTESLATLSGTFPALCRYEGDHPEWAFPATFEGFDLGDPLVIKIFRCAVALFT